MNRPLGTDREEDDLLSLEEEAMPRRKMMVNLAKNIHRACLVGNQAPIVKEMYDRITNPQHGDLVVEMTGHRETEYRGFGILIERRRETLTFENGEEVDGDDKYYADDIWYVQYGQKKNDVVRWTNASFIAALTDWNGRG